MLPPVLTQLRLSALLPDSKSITVLLFSVLRERVGRSSIEVAQPAEATVARILDQLAQDYPAIAEARRTVRVAVNGAYVGADTIVKPGDELALITPVSGG